MARGVSLHVGINRVSVEAFAAHPLLGCENDAVAMSRIALQRGFTEVKLLLGPDATFERVVGEIERYARGPGHLKEGDIFLFTFAGHGHRLPQGVPDEPLTREPDGKDEALVLFDRLLLDDYLSRVLWPLFDRGVRIVGVADSCHSATAMHAGIDLDFNFAERTTITAARVSDLGVGVVNVQASRSVVWRATGDPEGLLADEPGADLLDEEEGEVSVGVRDRAITLEARRAHLSDEANRAFYTALRAKIPPFKEAPEIGAQLLFMAACEDGGKTKDDLPNGAFTKALLEVWDDGAFDRDYVSFLNAIKAKLPPQGSTITPDPPPAFSSQSPFTI